MADINTLWRSKPFEALAASTPVLGLAPQDVFRAWRRRETPAVPMARDFVRRKVTMPPGWASRWTSWAATYLWQQIHQEVRKQGRPLKGLVVTSPHYLELVRKAPPGMATFYYCSDDYTQYEGWGSGVSLLETEVVRSVSHSFFVSQVLADRAVQQYGIQADRVSVSPNATDERFLRVVTEAEKDALFQEFPALKRPLVGVVGGINGRLDFELILECASMPETGSLVMVGPVDEGFDDAGWQRLLQHPKCVVIGLRPHDELPTWMQALDAALIPYKESSLNQACSPMRLFDHLASGKPIVSTEACCQTRHFHPHVVTGGTCEEILAAMRAALRLTHSSDRIIEQVEVARNHTWMSRARGILEHIPGIVQVHEASH